MARPGEDRAEELEPVPAELLVRATIHLPGLRVGWEALVDPNDPYIAGLVGAGYLVAVE